MIGQSIGPYRISAKLGAVGMGEVYRARDTKLDRDVAIKILPDSFAHDAERIPLGFSFTWTKSGLLRSTHQVFTRSWHLIDTFRASVVRMELRCFERPVTRPPGITPQLASGTADSEEYLWI